MRVLVKLYNMVDPAADGSVIPRQQTIQYLASSDYESVISNRVALCGFTHKDRVLDSQYKNVVGPDDQVLINGNYVGYIDKIFVRDEGDKYCYAFITIFDPDNFSGVVRDNIINFRGLMGVGVKLPSSVVIQAMWSPSNRAERIIRIKGMDFTQNPSFKGSGTVKVMSAVTLNDSDTKRFSNVPDGMRVDTKSFSMGEVVIEKVEDDASPVVVDISKDENPLPSHRPGEHYDIFEDLPDGKSLSSDEIISKFGRASDVALKTKGIPEVKVKVLKSIIDGSIGQELAPLKDIIRSEVRDGMGAEFDKLCDNHPIQIIEISKSIKKSDPDHDNLVHDKLLDFVKGLKGGIKLFSTVKSIQDRMIGSKFPKPSLIKRILDNYRYYYETNKSSMSNEDYVNLINMLKGDLRWLIQSVSEEIDKGVTLSSIYQLVRFNNDIYQNGILLSKLYRRVNIMKRIMGFIPIGLNRDWVESVSDFYQSVVDYVFGDNIQAEFDTLDMI